MRTRRYAFGLAVLALCVGCGGRAEGQGGPNTVDSGAPDGAPPSGSLDASPGRPPAQPPLGPDCPASIPTQSSPCTNDGIRCEYGTDPDYECNTLATCFNYAWDVSGPARDCPSPPPNPSCPRDRADVTEKAPCSIPGTSCFYAEGECGCAAPEEPPMPDASAPQPVWACEHPSPGCPIARPWLGATCTVQDQRCLYGVCGIEGIVELACESGYWVLGASPPCGELDDAP